MFYKNLSNTTKCFYGVTFKPGEIHNVTGQISDPKFVKVYGITDISGAGDSVDPPPISKEISTKKQVKTKNIIKEEIITDGSDSDK